MDWAGCYDGSNKKENLLEKEIFESIKEISSPPSYLTIDILMRISEWKAGIRNKGRIEKNDSQFVKEVTQVSLTTHNKKLKLEVLTLLSGVLIRMASSILFFCDKEHYTVMDYRAWNSLKSFDKIDGDIDDTFECWQKYNTICQEIAKRNDVSLRTLDT